jgi:hypothetical protein
VAADLVRRLADAVLYEGYLLWPYRKSALKNQQRFTFGGVYPPAWEDRSCMQVQVLLEGDEDAEVDVRVRFLHVVRRQILKIGPPSAPPEPVEELEVEGKRWVSWEEATEREIAPGPIRVVAGERIEVLPVREQIAAVCGEERFGAAPAGEQFQAVPMQEQIEAVSGGAIRRSWRALEGEVTVAREPLRPGLSRLTVRIANTTPWAGHTREDALRQTFCSTHAVLRVRDGAWVSLTDPPAALRTEAASCECSGAWPVLVGEEGDHGTTMLASPIILCDHPEIAPESPGDLFDSGEIDQMLVLNILAMTDEERRDMRDCDPRAREILERTESLSGEEIMRLHGAIREFGLVRSR